MSIRARVQLTAVPHPHYIVCAVGIHASGLKGNLVQIQGCPAAVSRNENRVTTHWPRGGWEATVIRWATRPSLQVRRPADNQHPRMLPNTSPRGADW
jgi:hypothetical protein